MKRKSPLTRLIVLTLTMTGIPVFSAGGPSDDIWTFGGDYAATSSGCASMPGMEEVLPASNLQALRSYQEEAFDKIGQFLARGNKYGYVQMATGTGKTRTFSHLIATGPYSKTLIVVPKTNLVDQTIEAIKYYYPQLKVHRYDGVIKEVCQQVLVTTYSSFEADHQEGVFDDIDLIILDEVHFSLSEKRSAAVEYFKTSSKFSSKSPDILGFTATDSFNTFRKEGSKINVSQLLGEKIFQYSLKQGLEEGYLSRFQIVKLELDEPELIKDLKKKRKDILAEENLEKLNIERINAIFPDLIQHSSFGEQGLRDQQGLIFTVSIKHAQDLSAKLNEVFGEDYSAPISSALSREKRQELIQRHKLKEIQVLVNVDVLSEGYDNDQVSYLIDFRPIKSSLRMLQIFGRLTRLNRSDPSRDKTYIQLILPDSGQILLEDTLKDEGLEDIRVFGNQNSRKGQSSTPKRTAKAIIINQGQKKQNRSYQVINQEKTSFMESSILGNIAADSAHPVAKKARNMGKRNTLVHEEVGAGESEQAPSSMDSSGIRGEKISRTRGPKKQRTLFPRNDAAFAEEGTLTDDDLAASELPLATELEPAMVLVRYD